MGRRIQERDLNNVSGETLPYTTSSPTPTIWAKVEGIIAGTNGVKDEWTSTATTTYTLSEIIDTAQPFLVFYNGQKMNEGASNDFTVTGTTLTFNFTTIAGVPIYIEYQKV